MAEYKADITQEEIISQELQDNDKLTMLLVDKGLVLQVGSMQPTLAGEVTCRYSKRTGIYSYTQIL